MPVVLERLYQQQGRGKGEERIYLSVGVLLGGLSGLYMATFAFGGVTAKIGFACLAALWLYIGLQAHTAIRRGAVDPL